MLDFKGRLLSSLNDSNIRDSPAPESDSRTEADVLSFTEKPFGHQQIG